ncbi:ACP phosphodiesterase [Vibrio sonorensis]|uniref:acyl carrier protein phosphodiesterase n=1 Tax=Vibrio sonorensis TaxID=1004316 RepID=UPI0008DA9FE4|nr:ACP phosphodiesterase [Vibrio sonorensis]
MNYLAHLHIADNCESSLLGNLLGDFVKGNPENRFASPIVNGIKLHRFVDRYTDNHPLMKNAKQYFPSKLKRYAPIALDMFWDHGLALNWNQFHSTSLTSFCRYAESSVTAEMVPGLPDRFIILHQNMWKGKWLSSYQDIENIGFALQKISLRSPRMAPLSFCYDTLYDNRAELNGIFVELYPDVLEKAANFSGEKEM